MKRLIMILLLISTILTSYSQTPLDYKVFEKINEYRVENGVRELKWDDKVYQAAKHHNDYMIKFDIFSHTEKGNAPHSWDRVTLYKVKWSQVGEILTIAYDDEISVDEKAAKIVQKWKNSPSHNRNMLTPDYTHGASSCGLSEYDTYPAIFSTAVFITQK
jgi:uncharacterized protein YkwD